MSLQEIKVEDVAQYIPELWGSVTRALCRADATDANRADDQSGNATKLEESAKNADIS